MVSLYITATREEAIAGATSAETDGQGRTLLCKDSGGTVVARYRWSEIVGYVIKEDLSKHESLASPAGDGVVIALSHSVSLALARVHVECDDRWTIVKSANREVCRFRTGGIVGYRIEPEGPLVALLRQFDEIDRGEHLRASD